MLNPDLCLSNTPTGLASLNLSLVDSSGAAITSVSPDQRGTLQASVKDSKGAAVPNVAVTFTTSDKTGAFVPSSGTALTDANGVARVGLPAGTQAGAFRATSVTTLGGVAVTGTVDYAVTSPSLTLSPLTISLIDSSGAVITSVSPERPGTLQAALKNDRGNAVPDVAVTFTTTDKTGAFVPSSATALTDANGVARVGLPAGTQAGGFTVTANAMVSGKATVGTASYAVTFPTLTLSALSINPATLSAGGNASVSVTVLSGSSPYAPPLPVSFVSPCVTAGKAAIGSPVLTESGIATASYSDKGCGVADIITASVAPGGAMVSKTGTITVLPATAGSFKFISATTTNIALKGTGGFGRQEFSTLKFEVYDNTGNLAAGKLVDFVFSDCNLAITDCSKGVGVGGLTLYPTSATSAADGSVTTLVSAGTIPTSVRVVGTIHGSSPLITTLSNILVISTGVPDQKHFSLATETGNCEGRDVDQTCSFVTATLGDHFGNPAPDGTAVNFTTGGGVIDASCVTGSLLTPPPDLLPPGSTPIGQTTNSKVGPGSGTCTVLLRASNPRPANGRVTVLAYAVGEENLFDANGNNVYDTGDTFTDKSLDIFRDDIETGIWSPGEPCIGPNLNGTCSTPGDGQYNGVLRNPQVPSAQTLYVSAQLVQIFSGSEAKITSLDASPTLSQCVNGTPFVNIAKTFGIAVRDNNPTVFAGNQANTLPLNLPSDLSGNILPAGTKIEFTTSNGTILSGTSFIAPNTNEPSAAAWIYYLTVQSDATQTGPGTTSGGVTNPSYVCSNQVTSGLLTVKVTTPLGVITTQSFSVTD
ncbi:hypothetical protein [Rhodoferax ferrireducens]|uniref:hypothetical protein n=1 Tax=Rhodoferax ferrireducens TaxID=192843 RepID=UPI003BB6F061